MLALHLSAIESINPVCFFFQCDMTSYIISKIEADGATSSVRSRHHSYEWTKLSVEGFDVVFPFSEEYDLHLGNRIS